VTKDATETREAPTNFIRAIIEHDLEEGRVEAAVTRFPPEPNGYAHIGHAKSICLNFALGKDYGGRCHLRFDDTNPETEDHEFVESIKKDIAWLGFDWGEHLYFASDYFDRFYALAQKLIRDGKAYVCSLDEDAIRDYRGTVTQPGRPSPDRDRPAEQSLALLEEMKRGDHPEGAYTLRAKIDMASPNMKMRDPLLYRIRHASHYRTGDTWHIYPMYDFAHCLSDSIEGITHSICTLEFENNRELYDWLIRETRVANVPHQYEMARLNLNYTVMSKRKLMQLVREGHVAGWDDPRMPTLAGMRRRGYRPEAIRDFCERIGVAKANSVVDIEQLESSVRADLNHVARRVLCVLDPLEVVITTLTETETLTGSYFPPDVPRMRAETRAIPFTKRILIERSDFMDDPPKRYHRLAPGREVRLRHGYVIKCDEVVRDAEGTPIELLCSHDPETLGRNPTDRKVKGTIHWVSADQARRVEVRLYDRLFAHERPDGDKDTDFKANLNPDSLEVVRGFIEPAIRDEPGGRWYQFERHGYFYADPHDSEPGSPVFNKTVGLRDGWAKLTETKTEKPAERPEPKPVRRTRQKPIWETRERDPEQRRRYDHYRAELGLSEEVADLLTAEREVADFFEIALTAHGNAQGVANWVTTELLRELKDRRIDALPFGPERLGELVALIDEGTISGRVAKDVFGEMMVSGEAPGSIVEAKGLRQVSDTGALVPMIESLIEANPDKVQRYRDGRTNMMGFFVGQIMKQTGGKANPKLVNELLRERLEG